MMGERKSNKLVADSRKTRTRSLANIAASRAMRTLPGALVEMQDS
jgi:hypothetical protein